MTSIRSAAGSHLSDLGIDGADMGLILPSQAWEGLHDPSPKHSHAMDITNPLSSFAVRFD
jgi:hypothetical protein